MSNLVQKSQHGTPVFIIPKNKGTVRFITDYHRLNHQLVRKPHTLPIIGEIMKKLCGGGCGGTPLVNDHGDGGIKQEGAGEGGQAPGRPLLRGRRHACVVRPPVAAVGIHAARGAI